MLYIFINETGSCDRLHTSIFSLRNCKKCSQLNISYASKWSSDENKPLTFVMFLSLTQKLRST